MVEVVEREPDDAALAGLLTAAVAEMAERYSEDAVYPLAEGARFLVALIDGAAVGCGALVPVEPGLVEMKRLYVRPERRGRGVARALMVALEEFAVRLGARRIRLETGTRQPEAIALYKRFGYQPIPTYGVYVGNPLSRCFAKDLP